MKQLGFAEIITDNREKYTGTVKEISIRFSAQILSMTELPVITVNTSNITPAIDVTTDEPRILTVIRATIQGIFSVKY